MQTRLSLLAMAFAGLAMTLSAQTPTSILLPATPGPCDGPIFTRVNISAPAPVGGLVVQLASSLPAVAAVPASVTVPQGATQANFNTSCVVQTQAIAVTITATAGGATQSALLNVLAPALLSVSSKPPTTTETGYSNSIKLTGPAPASGVVVSLTSSLPGLYPVPASVTIPAGSSGQSFVVSTVGPVSAPTTVTITATGSGVVKTGTALLMPATPTAISFQVGANVAGTATVVGGDSRQASVTVSGPAGAGGLIVQLASSRTSSATVPATVTIPAGQTTGGFIVQTTATSTPSTPVSITATVGNVSKTATITVTGTALDVFGLVKGTVVGGQTNQGRLVANNPAATGGLVVQLSSSNTAVALVPPTATIPVGADFIAFNIATLPVDLIKTVTITATGGAVTRSALLTVVPEGPTEFTITPDRTLGGTTLRGTLKALPSDDQFTVQLSTSDSSIATVPASVQFAAGETVKIFTITTKPVATSKFAVITAKTTNTQTKGAVLAVTISPTVTSGSVTVSLTSRANVDPPKIITFTLSTASVTGGSSTAVTGTVTLDGKAPPSFPINVSSSNASAIHAGSVTFPAGSTTGTFQLITGQVPIDVNVTLTVSNGGTSKSASILVKR